MRCQNYPQLVQPSPRPPPGSPRLPKLLEPPALSRPASASYLGALRPAWKAPSHSMRIDVAKVASVGADCQDKARSSSICCSSSIVISLTFEKDDAAGREEMTGSRIALATARGGKWGAGFVGVQGTGAEAKSGGHAKSLRPAFAHGTIGHSEQTPPLRIATGRRKRARCPVPSQSQQGKSPAVSGRASCWIRRRASGGSRPACSRLPSRSATGPR